MVLGTRGKIGINGVSLPIVVKAPLRFSHGREYFSLIALYIRGLGDSLGSFVAFV